MVFVSPARTIRYSIGLAAPSLILPLVAQLLLNSLAKLHYLAGDVWCAGLYKRKMCVGLAQNYAYMVQKYH